MPLYDYICTNGHVTEVMHGVNDSGPAECPQCGAEMRKLLSTPAIVFKGSGWAKKDRSSKPAATKSTTDSEAKPSAASDAKSDSTATSGSSSSDSSSSGGSSSSAGSSSSGSSSSDD
jgi:putative FmdB family regulatory protein